MHCCKCLGDESGKLSDPCTGAPSKGKPQRRSSTVQHNEVTSCSPVYAAQLWWYEWDHCNIHRAKGRLNISRSTFWGLQFNAAVVTHCKPVRNSSAVLHHDNICTRKVFELMLQEERYEDRLQALLGAFERQMHVRTLPGLQSHWSDPDLRTSLQCQWHKARCHPASSTHRSHSLQRTWLRDAGWLLRRPWHQIWWHCKARRLHCCHQISKHHAGCNNNMCVPPIQRYPATYLATSDKLAIAIRTSKSVFLTKIPD